MCSLFNRVVTIFILGRIGRGGCGDQRFLNESVLYTKKDDILLPPQGAEVSRFVLIAGEPIKEPVVQRGTSV